MQLIGLAIGTSAYRLFKICFPYFERVTVSVTCYASLYLMRRLPIDHPKIHVMFMLGQFVVKQIDGSFNAASPDTKLGQSIKRTQKRVHGSIDQTRN